MASGLKGKERSLDADQLRAISAALPGKLRAHQFSEAFIGRYAEELVQQALAEYARACGESQVIDNPGGWIVNTAFRRAIDQLRREGREATAPLPTEAALEVTDGTSAPPDEEAIRHIEAEQLHSAIRKLSVPQRQALSLYYFEERSTRDGADALGWSEPTFRRRRDSALRALRERFGVIEPVPQQGDRTAIEVGLAAWLSLAGAHGHAGRVTDQLVAVCRFGARRRHGTRRPSARFRCSRALFGWRGRHRKRGQRADRQDGRRVRRGRRRGDVRDRRDRPGCRRDRPVARRHRAKITPRPRAAQAPRRTRGPSSADPSDARNHREAGTGSAADPSQLELGWWGGI